MSADPIAYPVTIDIDIMGVFMTLWTIIPVKQLAQSKRRLKHLLSAAERADLMTTFLDNLLAVLDQVEVIDHILVVTGDERAAEVAASRGAEALAESEPYDLNSAVTQGCDYAVSTGATAVLVLPADLPFVRIEDIGIMLRPLDHAIGSLAAICTDEKDEGTNALLLSPPDNFEFHYGPGSAGRHVAEAERRGRDVVLVRTPGLRFDLDTENDWLIYNGYSVQLADE